MKKIMNGFTMLFVLIILQACVRPLPLEIIFEVPTQYIHYIDDEVPDFMEEIVVELTDGTSLLEFVTINDALVNYDQVGEYALIFNLNYEEQKLQKFSEVKVVRAISDDEISFNIYYLNDLHGAILEDENSMGLAKIANVVMNEKISKPEETLFLAGGDMLQGQIISNWYDGASVIEILNDMELDAFVIGNHEFDWGIDEVTKYFDGSFPLQANYPLLGANVYKKETNALEDGFEPYTIIEKQGVKIAVIGTMGYGLESSIAYARVKDHIFVDPVERVGYWAEHVRKELGAEIVIAINHMDSSQFNNQVAGFTGDKKVDMIFNGHTHQAYTQEVNGKPLLQTGAYGENLGNVLIHYQKGLGVTSFTMKNLNESNDARLRTEEESIQLKIEGFYEEIESLYEPIMKSSSYYSQSELTIFIAKLMQSYFGADVGVHNFGGTRDSILQNEDISYAKLFQISPFDNTVVLVEVTGSILLGETGNHGLSFKDGLSSGQIQSNQTYLMAVNDYIFGSSSTLRNLPNVTYTGKTVLDIFVELVETQKELGHTSWSTSLPLVWELPLAKQAYIIPKFDFVA